MAVIDNGATATLFVSMAGFDVPGPEVRDPATGYPVTVNKATVLRIELSIAGGKPPAITSQTVIANGFGARADRDVFLIGPTGLALGRRRHALRLRRARQPRSSPSRMRRRAPTAPAPAARSPRTACCKRPLALVHDRPTAICWPATPRTARWWRSIPATGKQIYAQWIDTNQAQSPPGNGDLFGIAMTPGRQGLLLCRGRHEHADGGGAMSERDDTPATSTRRGLLADGRRSSAVAGSASPAARPAPRAEPARPPSGSGIEPFWGEHQGGIVTPAQSHTYFAAFDLVDRRSATTSSRCCRPGPRPPHGWRAGGRSSRSSRPRSPTRPTHTVTTTSSDDAPKPVTVALPDSGEALGLPPARLTVTFGFGAGLFVKDGKDRYGLAAAAAGGAGRSAALQRRPVGAETRTGGDLSVQACADDPQVAFHAVRQLARLADDVAEMRWAQTGFMPGFGAKQHAAQPDGLQGRHQQPAGRPIRRRWTRSSGSATKGRTGCAAAAISSRAASASRSSTGTAPKSAFQEQTVGRHKHVRRAARQARTSSTPLDLEATDKDGNPVIPENAHVRLAAAASNDGAQILRRPYSYNDGVEFHRRALAALAPGHGIRRRPVLRLLSARPAHRLHQDLRARWRSST